MAEHQTEGTGATPRSPVDAMRGAMQGLHREIGQQHKELMESQGLLNTTMAWELSAMRKLMTESSSGLSATQDMIRESLTQLWKAQRAQGRLFVGLFVVLWLGTMLGFGLMPLWR